MAFLPYLNFGGDCRQALTRYQEIFGGDLTIMGPGDMPGDETPPEADLVIHGTLSFDGHLLMASDVVDPSAYVKPQGMYVSYTAPDADDARGKFAALSEGGEIEMPIGETFWSPCFGICVDRFGTPWMIDSEAAAG